MAYSNIDKPSDYFNTVLYTGDGTTSNAITGVGFQPDWIWLKNRSAVTGHHLADVVRGKSGTNYLSLSTDTTAAEAAQGDNDGVNTIGSDGFTVGYTNSTAWNNSGNNYASWNWLADNTSGSSNTDGSITSTVSANTTSGFSIVSYTGTGSNATVGHGLGVAPKVLLIKERDNAQEWHNGFDAIGWDKYMHFNTDAQATSALPFQSTAPTSSVFSLGASNGTNRSSGGMIAYCFAEKKGFSKFGSYVGNGNADGTFVYTGFKPAFVIQKRYSSIGSWYLWDNVREPSNVVTKRLVANTTAAEASNYNTLDFLSNGFKFRDTNNEWNGSGDSYIYMAFAESPLVGSNFVPTNAR